MVRRFISCVALAAVGCVAHVDGDNGGTAGSGGQSSGNTGGTGVTTDPPDPSDPRLEARAWRLTPAQYNAELQRAFPGAPAVDLPVGGAEYGLTNISSAARIDTGNAATFSEVARAIGSWVAKQGASAARCDAFGTSACVDTFLGWFPELAYRRPPTADELKELRALYDELEPQYGAEWAFSAVVRTVLLSPQFLYRTEIGPIGSGVVQLDDYEIASLLSFSLTDRGPDQGLLDAARAGKLRDSTLRVEQARRLMSSSSGIWQRFFWEWLKMSTLQSQGTETGLDAPTIAGLEEEYRAFVDHIVVQNRGTLSDLLTSSGTWGSPEVATYYGVSHPGGGLAPLQLDPNQRAGLLTLGAWLVAHGKKGRDNVVRRGMGVYRDAMCNDISPLNVDLVAAQNKLVGADATIKEIAAARGGNAVCGACHATSDPVGLSFESFGGDGRFQSTYPDGKPVEAAVVWNDVPYENAAQISAALAKDERFQQCLVRRFGHFLLGADVGDPLVARAPAAAYQAFKDSSGSFEELVVALVRDAAFIERRK